MEIIFEKPDYLWLLFVIPIIIIVHFLTLKITTRKAVKFANFEVIQRITGGESLSKNFSLLVLRTFIILLFIFALAGLTLSYVGQGSTADFAIAIDASNSMLVQDLLPNRLEAAKEKANEFIDTLNSRNNIAVISFGGNAFVESELTIDHFEAKAAVLKINARDTGGTSLGDAIISSVNTLIPSVNNKIVILITDGRSNVGADVDNAIEYAKLKQAAINTIGIGTNEGGEYLQGVNLTLDENILMEIAASTNGKYFKAESSESLSEAYREIAQTTETTIFRNLTLSFTLAALFLLLLEWILFNTRYRTIP